MPVEPIAGDWSFLRPQPKSRVRAAFVSRAWREAILSCGTFEWMTLGYLAVLNVLILLFRRNLPGAPTFFWVHIALAVAVVSLCWASNNWPSTVLLLLRHWYPMLLFLSFFEELQYLVHLIRPGWLDTWLIQFDFALCGVHPTVWLEQFSTPALNDLMQFAYVSYYFYGIVLCGLLYYRKEQHNLWKVWTATAAAYYLGYLISILFPIEGPFHTLAGLQRVQLTGGFFTSLIGFIESWGRVHGAAFPSAHVSGSFVALLGAWRYRRWLFWIFLPFFGAMLISTIYGRYHYLADVLAGLLVGAIGWAIADNFLLGSQRLSWVTSARLPLVRTVATSRVSDPP